MGVSKIYLISYNIAQTAGWALVLVKIIHSLLTPPQPGNHFQSVQPFLDIFQTLALLEVVHCALALVRAPVGTTLVQVGSRLAVLWLVANRDLEVQKSIGSVLFILAWSITECIRYPYYACNLMMTEVPYFLTWLRYTLFIVLYPLGVTGELLSIYTTLPSAGKTEFLRLDMPNRVNFSFNLYYGLIVFACLYGPLFPQMYGYMLGQRKKILGENAKITKKVQ